MLAHRWGYNRRLYRLRITAPGEFVPLLAYGKRPDYGCEIAAEFQLFNVREGDLR